MSGFVFYKLITVLSLCTRHIPIWHHADRTTLPLPHTYRVVKYRLVSRYILIQNHSCQPTQN
jgi:hypothetical protein